MATKSGSKNSLWQFHIATIAGIPVYIHLTFVLFLVWILFGFGAQSVGAFIFTIVLFLCVALHELGHALAARGYHIETSSITLYPIGGVALMEKSPKAMAEVWVALAGPAVNVIIAASIALGHVAKTGTLPGLTVFGPNVSFIQAVFAANVALAAFNLIPAFPMDGGRVLRAMIALRVPEPKATTIAVGIGQVLAAILFFIGLFGDLLLSLVAFFVFVAAASELAGATAASIIEPHTAGDAMLTDVEPVSSGQTIDEAAQLLLSRSQRDFPVVVGDEVLGILVHSDIVRALSEGRGGEYVAGFMHRDFVSVPVTEPLERVSDLLHDRDFQPVAVRDRTGLLVGMVTKDSLSEFIMIENVKRKERRG